MPIAINIWLAPRATASRTCFIGVTFAVINPSGNLSTRILDLLSQTKPCSKGMIEKYKAKT